MKRGKFLGAFMLGLVAVTLVATPVLPVLGQGVLMVERHPGPVPLPRPIPWPRPRPEPPPVSYRIKEITAEARIQQQVARVNVSQTFVNTGSRQMEVSFVFPLPADAAIDQLTLLVDGKEFSGQILPAKEARSIYEGYVRRNQDPALLEWIGFGMFKTSVFPVPPGAERKVTLQYSQLLRKEGELVDFLFPLATARYTSQPIEKISMDVSIESSEKIKSIYSPTHNIEVQRNGDRNARVRWELSQSVPSNDFRLFYDTDSSQLGASLVSYRPKTDEDGFFLMLASPDVPTATAEEISRKTVIFVVDRSGSMSGPKIEQAKEAMRFVMNNLREGDLFNIVAYDGNVEAFRPELQRFSNESRQQALGFIDGVYAGGSTNIDEALQVALSLVQDDKQPTFVIFLTDGLPTTGEQNEAKIVANARQRNSQKARILSLGVGYDVNSRLLDRLVQANRGSSQYVRPDENIEQHVGRMYSRISSPVMTDVQVEFVVAGADEAASPSVNRVYPKQVNDLFAGEQLVLVGRYRVPGEAKIVIRGKAGKDEQVLEFPVNLVESSAGTSFAFAEKLWAIRRIGEIIDELDLKGTNDELIQELVALSTKHGVLTPYTSFLADENRRGDLADAAGLRIQATDRLRLLEEIDGRGAFIQRAEKQRLRRATSLAPESGPTNLSSLDATPNALGGALGAGGRASGVAGAAALPGVRFRDLATDREVVAESLQTIGDQTLYKRGNLWIAANARDLDLEKQRDQVTEVTRFSDDYFRLLADTTASENAVLAAQKEGEELLIRISSRAYLIK